MNKTASRNKKKPAQPVAPIPGTATAAGFIPWPPLIYICGIALSFALHALLPLPWLSSPMSDILVPVGWLCVLAFAALMISAIGTMRKAKTPVNPNSQPQHLVTNGPFAITRNPIYLADTLLLIGIGLVAGILWFLPLALLAAFVTRKVAIDREEKWLHEKFGKRYRDYTHRVRRWV